MGWSGYEECITEKGYYFHRSAQYFDHNDYMNEYKGDRVKWYRNVDITNGYGQERDFTEDAYGNKVPEPDLDKQWYYDEEAPKVEIGFDDEWHEDHYGNKYAVKMIRYKPENEKHWDKFTPAVIVE